MALGYVKVCARAYVLIYTGALPIQYTLLRWKLAKRNEIGYDHARRMHGIERRATLRDEREMSKSAI